MRLRGPQHRSASARRTATRLAAGGSALLAGVLAAHLHRVAAAAPYLGLVASCLLLLALASAAWLWTAGSLASRACAAVLAGALATGQALNALVGLPGAASLHQGIGTWGLVAAAVEAFVLFAAVSSGLPTKR